VCPQHGALSVHDWAAALHEVAPFLRIILATFSTRTLGAPLLASSGVSELISYPVTSSELAAALSRCLAGSTAEGRRGGMPASGPLPHSLPQTRCATTASQSA
jgi:hypothetical protein